MCCHTFSSYWFSGNFSFNSKSLFSICPVILVATLIYVFGLSVWLFFFLFFLERNFRFEICRSNLHVATWIYDPKYMSSIVFGQKIFDLKISWFVKISNIVLIWCNIYARLLQFACYPNTKILLALFHSVMQQCCHRL